MKGDFSRLTFDPARAFSRVLMQQGRVLVDADWNELNDLLLHYLRGLGADLIGPHGGPVHGEGGRSYVGFQVRREPPDDLGVYSGHYYVDGILCVAEHGTGGARVAARRYRDQPFLSEAEREQPLPPAFLVYLDVWERHLTALEHGPIREVALGGPDTCSRSEVVWHVRLLTGEALQPFLQFSCETFPLEDFRRALRGSPPLLKARARRPVASDDPCITRPDARYRGNENQLYRVEIHEASAGGGLPARFKWSRENGSVAARWLEKRGNDLVVAGVRDDRHGFSAGDWIEVAHDDLELGGRPGLLLRVNRVEGEVLTVDPPGDGQGLPDPGNLESPKLRRWDQRDAPGSSLAAAGGAIPVREGTTASDWIPLEDGIEVQFQPPGEAEAAHRYRTGDYWLIPARVATGDVEWPRSSADQPLALPPRGIQHPYAPLLLVRTGGPTVDLRRSWTPLAVCRAGLPEEQAHAPAPAAARSGRSAGSKKTRASADAGEAASGG
jgi:hypothetical protein